MLLESSLQSSDFLLIEDMQDKKKYAFNNVLEEI